MNNQGIIVLFLSGTLLAIAVAVFLIVLLITQRSKQHKFALEKAKLKTETENKVLSAKIEAQERTMNGLSIELHDNVSQLLYLMQTNIKVMTRENPQLGQDKLMAATTGILNTIIKDIQNLSRSLNGDLLKGVGLIQSLQDEIEQLNNRQQLEGIISIEGAVCTMPWEQELMVFRIIQEAIHNALKHSGAKQITIALCYSDNNFGMTVTDNGKGFIKENLVSAKGIGMLSMHHRARLINGNLQINSVIGQGTTLSLQVPVSSS
jgi:signal transduction histidine kinase